MFANLILAVLSVGTIFLYSRVRTHSKKIANIEKAGSEPDERVGEHERKLIELEETLKKDGTEIASHTKRITKLEDLAKDQKESTKRISTLEKSVEKLSK